MAILGSVAEGREALISLNLLGPGESSARIEAVVDTGFTGHLVLPPTLVSELGLPLRGSRDSFLADGSMVSLDAHIESGSNGTAGCGSCPRSPPKAGRSWACPCSGAARYVSRLWTEGKS